MNEEEILGVIDNVAKILVDLSKANDRLKEIISKNPPLTGGSDKYAFAESNRLDNPPYRKSLK